MNVQKTLFTTLTASLLLTTNAQALEVIKGEDINYGDPQSHATLDRTIQAEEEFLNYLFPIEKGTQDYGTEGFEQPERLEPKRLDTGMISLELDFGDAGTATLTGDKKSRIQNIQDSKYGQYSASGENYWYTKVTSDNDSTFKIDFAQDNIAAFGFYNIDLGDYGAQLDLKITYLDGSYSDITGLNTQESGSAMYVGVVSPEKNISHVEFNMKTDNDNNGNGDAFSFDNFTVATTEQLKARSAD